MDYQVQSIEAVRAQGWEAYHAQMGMQQNPYALGSSHWDEWLMGFHRASLGMTDGTEAAHGIDQDQ